MKIAVANHYGTTDKPLGNCRWAITETRDAMTTNTCKHCGTTILGEFPIKKFMISYFTYCPNCQCQNQILWGYDPANPTGSTDRAQHSPGLSEE